MDFNGTKWDACEWTEEMKAAWQEKMFELGYKWLSGEMKYFKLKDEPTTEQPVPPKDTIADTMWLQLESLKRFARYKGYSWGGDGAFYYFGNEDCHDKFSLKNMQIKHNGAVSEIKLVDETYLQWSKKENKLICQKHLVKLV